jgi:hypothetical protein
MGFISVFFDIEFHCYLHEYVRLTWCFNCALRLRSTAGTGHSAAQAKFAEVSSKHKLKMFESGELWDCLITVGSSDFYHRQVGYFLNKYILLDLYAMFPLENFKF